MNPITVSSATAYDCQDGWLGNPDIRQEITAEVHGARTGSSLDAAYAFQMFLRHSFFAPYTSEVLPLKRLCSLLKTETVTENLQFGMCIIYI